MKALKIYKKMQRNLQLNMLAKASPEGLKRLGEKRLLRLFQKAENSSFALQKLLKKKRIEAKKVTSIREFSALDFSMSKENSFNLFSLDELCRPGVMKNLKNVLTSSGHSGNFAYGLTTWQQGKSAPDLIDLALQKAFQIDQKKTLLVNCLPMGVRFLSNCVTQAEVSVREDMALALIKKFAPHFDQIIIACDPLFLKLLMDASPDWDIDWHNIHTNLIIGEESFGENYRNYVGQKLHINPDDPDSGIIGSSMGVGELGLNLCFETIETIALRRTICANAELAAGLFGCHDHTDPQPMLFAYNPLSFYLETKAPDRQGYGTLQASILDPSYPIPLFRYQTGDQAKLLASQEIQAAFTKAGLPLPQLPKLPLICIQGRDKDRLGTGLHIGTIKDALYRDHDFADKITGAFRIDQNQPSKIHIQLRRGEDKADCEDYNLCNGGHILYAGQDIKLWDYDDFPYGKSIDYERKFTYLK